MTKELFLDRRTKEHKITLSGGSIAQPPPFEGGFKGDVLLSTFAFCSRVHHHSKENIPLAPFKRGRLRDAFQQMQFDSKPSP